MLLAGVFLLHSLHMHVQLTWLFLGRKRPYLILEQSPLTSWSVFGDCMHACSQITYSQNKLMS